MQTILTEWSARFEEFAGSIQSQAIIAAPYITAEPLQKLASSLGQKQPSVKLLTNLRADSLLRGSLDASAIAEFCHAMPKTTVRHLTNLHAKVYVADLHTAIVTSGNLTQGALHRNHEYGVRITDQRVLRRITDELQSLWDRARDISIRELELLAQLTLAFRKEHASTLDSLQGLSQDLEDRVQLALQASQQALPDFSAWQLDATEDDLTELRGQPWEHRNAKFRRTIRYLLGSVAATTDECYSFVQYVHPELCDDERERDGDLKWRHRVRNILNRSADARQGRWYIKSA